MKQSDKDKIRAAISRVSGRDMGEVHPEFFLGDNGAVTAELHKTEGAGENNRQMFGIFTRRRVTAGGKPIPVLPLGKYGCN